MRQLQVPSRRGRVRSHLILCIATGVWLAALNAAHAADDPSVEVANDARVPSPAATAATQDNVTESIRFEREILERQADRQMASIQSLAQLTLVFFGAAAAIAGIMWRYFLGSSKQELRDSLHATATKQFAELIEKEAAPVRQRLSEIQEEIDALQAYLRRPVTWITGDGQEADPEVLSALHAGGLTSINVVSPQLGTPFAIGTPDLVVLCYDGSPEASRRLALTVDVLRHRTPPVPIVVHTFSAGGPAATITAEDERLLAGYRWYVPTNVPLQLIAQTFALLRRTGGALHA